MDEISVTVFFQEPFWVGVVERITEGRLRFSPAVETAVRHTHVNPKRMQKEVHRQMRDTGIGTKSQQALKLQQEEKKTERRTLSREYREAESLRKFELKQQKRKEKHRGR